MPKKDWTQITTIFKTKNKTYLKEFLNSNEVFLPNDKHLEKANPANGCFDEVKVLKL